MSEARLRWQCRRGMRELDVLLTAYLDRHYAGSDGGQKAAFQQLLTLSDPEVNGYLLGNREPPEGDIALVVARIRGRIGT